MTESDWSPPLPELLDRAVTLAGVAGAVVAFTAILASTLLAPWFSWTGNALSDLGHPSVAYSWLFNWGLVVAGLLGSAFVPRVALAAENRVHLAGSAVLLGATGSLFAIGAFPAGHRWHNPASLSFFVLLTYGLLVYGTGDVLAGRPRAGLAAVWLGTLNATGWLVWTVVYFLEFAAGAGRPGVAIPELVGAVALAAWVVPVTRRLRRRAGARDAETAGAADAEMASAPDAETDDGSAADPPGDRL